MSLFSLSKKTRASIIFAVSLGNFLEWYELYLYVYWAPTLSKIFFNADDIYAFIHLFTIFGIGFLMRPLGGIFFGRLGDWIGRKKALIFSIIAMILPTFAIGLLPTRAETGIFAPIMLTVLRICQSFPAGGELPGAACFLYESSSFASRRFMVSWTSFGYQLGILFSILESLFLKQFLSPQTLMHWGWRISFMVGGVLGLLGLILRATLHETPLFHEMQLHEKIPHVSLSRVLVQNKSHLLLGLFFCAFNSSAFYALSINFPKEGAGTYHLSIAILILIAITLPLPFWGVIGDRFNNKKMVIGSTIAMIFLIGGYPFVNGIFKLLTITIFCLLYSLTSALIPYLLCDLFHTRVRFTCAALSFNLADSIFGGFTPVLALFIQNVIEIPNALCWILLFSAFFSLLSYFKIKEGRSEIIH